MTLLEVGYSARTAQDMPNALRTPPLAAMPVEYSTPAIEDRALGVQRLLAERGQHRAPSIPDLPIAATAEITDRIVLHTDKDFELIADLTGQPLERLATSPASLEFPVRPTDPRLMEAEEAPAEEEPLSRPCPSLSRAAQSVVAAVIDGVTGEL